MKSLISSAPGISRSPQRGGSSSLMTIRENQFIIWRNIIKGPKFEKIMRGYGAGNFRRFGLNVIHGILTREFGERGSGIMLRSETKEAAGGGNIVLTMERAYLKPVVQGEIVAVPALALGQKNLDWFGRSLGCWILP